MLIKLIKLDLIERKFGYLSTLIKLDEYLGTQFKGIIQVIRLDKALEFADKVYKDEGSLCNKNNGESNFVPIYALAECKS